MKSFIQEAVNESLLLDRALSRLEQEHPGIKKIALLHYSPIQETVEGEPTENLPLPRLIAYYTISEVQIYWELTSVRPNFFCKTE